MKAADLREMSEKELYRLLDTNYRDLIKLRFNYAVTRSLQNPSKIRLLRRSIARILTVQKERTLLNAQKPLQREDSKNSSIEKNTEDSV